ncbi:divalent-cation tolerance protein CutA [Paracoccus marinaquae]|uniref:Divalent-cation tolerance protein CutA n=1 Tax=Paracoccus marinaquae TaxID=2841926 RepID=A0ABS6AEE0_9RHOB|nr:divalent-cation tolerance protein CutA [Paracoccus marinaquae]MBU3028571.1 divalent-cation tolerance protein CutA [Paracoccus marinaquae]
MLHVTTTCPDLDCARRLARQALEQRLAACANITPGIVSLFHWQGRIDEEPELQLAFKTTEARREALVDLIGRLHPYDLPVIWWEAVGTTATATEWLQTETR